MSLLSIFKKEDPSIKEAKKISQGKNTNVFEQNPSKSTRRGNEEAERRRDIILDKIADLRRNIFNIDSDLFNNEIEEIVDKMRRIQLNGDFDAMEIVDNLILESVNGCTDLVNRGAKTGLLRALKNVKQLVNERFSTLDYFMNPDYLKLYTEKQAMIRKFQAEQSHRADQSKLYHQLGEMYEQAEGYEKRSIQNEAMRIESEVQKIDHEIGVIESSLDLFDEALSACKSGLILDASPLSVDLSGILNTMLDTSLDNKIKLAEISKYKQKFEEARVKGGSVGITVNTNLGQNQSMGQEQKEFHFKKEL